MSNQLDEWLNNNANARYNLGESGVTNLLINDILSLDDYKTEFLNLDFNHNDCQGSEELRTEISNLYADIEPHEILVTTGVTEAILVYFSTIFKSNSNIIVVLPTFHNLYNLPKQIGFEVRKIFLKFDEKFELPLDQIRQLIDHQTKAIVLTTPSNPLGTVLSSDSFDSLLQMTKYFDCDVVLDEHYRLMSHTETDFLPSLFKQNHRIISFGSPGKCLGCVGLRVGWIVGSKDIIERCLEFKTLSTHSIFKGSDFLAYQILKNRHLFIGRYQSWLKSNINFFDNFLKKNFSAIEWVKPSAGTVAFPRLKVTKNTKLFAENLLKKMDVLILPGECFDMPGFFRIRLGVEPTYFQEATDRMGKFLSHID